MFVIGAPRSGTTHLASALHAHPRIAITHEAYLVHYFKVTNILATLPAGQTTQAPGFRITGLLNPRYIPLFARLQLEHAHAMIRDFYAKEFRDKPFTRWGDKLHSSFVVPEILAAFPRAQFIHVVRDGRDRAVSAMRFERRQRKETGYTPVSAFEHHCRFWAHTHRELLDLLDDDNAIQVHYEDLVQGSEREVERCLRFLGLGWTDEVTSYLDQEASRLFDRHTTSASPEASIGRWEEELSDEQKDVAQDIMGELLEALGYRAS